ncbi:unnamed protein product [Heligmosomoides polygyrus]|uniref:Uncharacterized protein n=1 Tax=Heligmosomoides polygyrus TaxID=6339 RepID=A0A183FUA0_HELPZ|nr:unnamed protein product [Heligmosomoides polygyrus]
METKMLRWTAGVTRMDRIRNEAIRQKFGVAPIADKMREARLRWYMGSEEVSPMSRKSCADSDDVLSVKVGPGMEDW